MSELLDLVEQFEGQPRSRPRHYTEKGQASARARSKHIASRQAISAGRRAAFGQKVSLAPVSLLSKGQD